jgi:hypothetical protein
VRRTVVVAGSAAQFFLWCRQNGRDPRSSQVIYADRPEKLYGLVDVDVVRFGTPWVNPRAFEIERQVGAIRARQHSEPVEPAHLP